MGNKPHKVEFKDLIEWEQEKLVEFASSRGKGTNKTLYRRLNGNYVVKHYDTIEYEGLGRIRAIETYNNLP